jgi:hypothetical protein
MVELVRRYCNRPDLQERLAAIQPGASQRRGPETDSDALTVSGRVPDAWRVRDRLTEADVQSLISEFLTGTPKRVLAERYVVSFSTVKRILRKHGVRRPS